MTQHQIDELISNGKFPEDTNQRQLIETHISWVILCDQFVYKIKKPIHYSFLDFSTLVSRKYYCERELLLNRRLTKDVYLEVLPIYQINDEYQIGGTQGNIIDYALRMHKLDPEKRMDILVRQGKVSTLDIENLAKRIAELHQEATIINEKDVLDIKNKFNDLATQSKFISDNLSAKNQKIIAEAITTSNDFLHKNEALLNNRLSSGFYRDGHGDLHSRNIFLLPEPTPFDCIEFNDEYRQIDILDEVAFLCMDLDALGRKDLSNLFIKYYNQFQPVIRNEAERKLFVYYKSYRANIRAKVNLLRASSAVNNTLKAKAKSEVTKYLELMKSYLTIIENEAD